jgi:hypothetical protein
VDDSSSEKQPQPISSPRADAETRAIKKTNNDTIAIIDAPFLYIPVINKIPVMNSTYGNVIASMLIVNTGSISYLSIAFAKSCGLKSLLTDAYMNIAPIANLSTN